MVIDKSAKISKIQVWSFIPQQTSSHEILFLYFHHKGIVHSKKSKVAMLFILNQNMKKYLLWLSIVFISNCILSSDIYCTLSLEYSLKQREIIIQTFNQLEKILDCPNFQKRILSNFIMPYFGEWLFTFNVSLQST